MKPIEAVIIIAQKYSMHAYVLPSPKCCHLILTPNRSFNGKQFMRVGRLLVLEVRRGSSSDTDIKQEADLLHESGPSKNIFGRNLRRHLFENFCVNRGNIL